MMPVGFSTQTIKAVNVNIDNCSLHLLRPCIYEYKCICVFMCMCGSWVTWLSRDTFSEDIHGPRCDCVRNTGKDDVMSLPLRTPFSNLALVFTSAQSQTCLAVLALIHRFEADAGVTADFPVQWPESESPRGEPLCEGFFFEGGICPCWLPLELLARRNHYLFQFQIALCFPLVAFHIMFVFQYFDFEVVVGLKVPGVSSLHHVEED